MDDQTTTFDEVALTRMELCASIDALREKRMLKHLPRRHFFGLPVILMCCPGAAVAWGLADPVPGAEPPPRHDRPIVFTYGPPPICGCWVGKAIVDNWAYGGEFRCTRWRGHAGAHVTDFLPEISNAMRLKLAAEALPATTIAHLSAIGGGLAGELVTEPAAPKAPWPHWGFAWEDGKEPKPIAVQAREITADEALPDGPVA